MGPFRSREPLQQMTGGTCWLKPAFRKSGRASNGSFPFATACRAEKRSKLSCGSCASLAGFPGWKSPLLRSAKGDRVQPDSVVRPTVNRSGVRDLTAGLDQSAACPVGNPYVILAGQLPITKTSAEFNNHVPYHCRRRSSEQKPGPMAASRPIAPGSGRRCFITSSSTTSTEAEERFPTLRRQSQEASSCPLCNPSAVAQASSTFGPPVCRTQL